MTEVERLKIAVGELQKVTWPDDMGFYAIKDERPNRDADFRTSGPNYRVRTTAPKSRGLEVVATMLDCSSRTFTVNQMQPRLTGTSYTVMVDADPRYAFAFEQEAKAYFGEAIDAEIERAKAEQREKDAKIADEWQKSHGGAWGNAFACLADGIRNQK